MLYSMYESELNYVDIQEIEAKLGDLMLQFTIVQTKSYFFMKKEINQIYRNRTLELATLETNVSNLSNQFIIGDE